MRPFSVILLLTLTIHAVPPHLSLTLLSPLTPPSPLTPISPSTPIPPSTQPPTTLIDLYKQSQVLLNTISTHTHSKHLSPDVLECLHFYIASMHAVLTLISLKIQPFLSLPYIHFDNPPLKHLLASFFLKFASDTHVMALALHNPAKLYQLHVFSLIRPPSTYWHQLLVAWADIDWIFQNDPSFPITLSTLPVFEDFKMRVCGCIYFIERYMNAYFDTTDIVQSHILTIDSKEFLSAMLKAMNAVIEVVAKLDETATVARKNIEGLVLILDEISGLVKDVQGSWESSVLEICEHWKLLESRLLTATAKLDAFLSTI